MFEDLIRHTPQVDDDTEGFVPLGKVPPAAVVDAQVETTEWLKSLGAASPDSADRLEAQAARTAFSSMVTANPQTHAALAEIKTPAAVQHLVGLLTAYDWEFVQQAKELRGYTVAKILEETNNPTASIRLKALALLGKVTEIGLFTDKIEVKKTELTDTELEQRIKDKLSKMSRIVEITDVTDVVELDRSLSQAHDAIARTES